jgi:citrate lyase subunit beta / citryl-CoA lyase
MTPPPVRSWLYVPGDRPDLAEKAFTGDADAIVLDLEDGVAVERKGLAREHVARLLRAPLPKPAWVRVNPAGSADAAADLDAIGGAAVAGVRLPKSEAPDAVREVADGLPAGAGLHCLLETALGVERAFELARAHPAVTALALGEADLRAELGATSDEALLYARSRCVIASAAAGLQPPVQSVWTDTRDLDGLRESTLRGRALGFVGRAAIHPAQIAVINEAFTPSDDEVRAARELVRGLEQARAAGGAVMVLPDGRFVDKAVADAAERTIALAGVERG